MQRRPRPLIALALLVLGATSCSNGPDPRAVKDDIRRDLRAIDSALMKYVLSESAHAEGMDDLQEFISEDHLVDPWGQPYKLVPAQRGTPHNVVSYGPDRAPGGEGLDADLDLYALKAGKL